MFSLLSSYGPELPIALLFLGLLGFRLGVTPRTSIWIKADPMKVFNTINLFDGKVSDYGRTKIVHELVDAERQTYQYTYTTSIVGGTARSFSALFRISESIAGRRLNFSREGIEGKPKSSELLDMEYDIEPENGGTRLRTAYHWGPRPLLAQVVARSDLWGGSYRLKGLIETGVGNERPYAIIAALVALVTGIITLGTFSLFLDWRLAVMVVIVLLVHEFGHLLAYRMMGQPWGRMMFLPFLGAIAMPRLPFETQAQAVFASLMGPGFSTLLAIICAVPYFLWPDPQPYLIFLGLFTVGINIFNLVPAEPLDGGIALRSVFNRLIGGHARFGLMGMGALIIGVGLLFQQLILVIFGAIAMLANLKDRKIDAGLDPLSSLQLTISAFSYIAMGSAYVTLYKFFTDQINLLPPLAL